MADDIVISDSPEALADRAAEDFAQLVNQTLEKQDRFSLVLAGGLTPKLFYERLAKEPYKSSIPWAKIWIFWGDERCVPPRSMPIPTSGWRRSLCFSLFPSSRRTSRGCGEKILRR